MNKKDIALSVGGILASMVVAYLIYRMQQRDAALAAANAANASASANASAYQQASYLAALPSINTSSTSSPSITTEDTSAATTSSPSISADPTLSAIISGFFTGSQSGGNTTGTDINQLLLPPVQQATSFTPSSGGVTVPTVTPIDNTTGNPGVMQFGGGLTLSDPTSGIPGVTPVPVSSPVSGSPGVMPITVTPAPVYTGASRQPIVVSSLDQ